MAARLEASPQQVALAWLLQRSPTMTVIPGTASVAHLRENVAAGGSNFAGLVFPFLREKLAGLSGEMDDFELPQDRIDAALNRLPALT